MMHREPRPDLYVLDTIADDAKNLDAILTSLNGHSVLGWHRRWGRPFTHDEVVTSLARMIKEDYVRAAILTPDAKWLEELVPRSLPPGDFEEAWFAIRPRGRMIHANWDPGDLSDMISET
jgi:hypothetical protein